MLNNGGGYRGPAEIGYLFVDGGCLRTVAHSLSLQFFGDREALRINYYALKQSHQKVFYYDAVPAQDHNEEREAWIARISPQTDAFAKIAALEGFHVQLGDLRGREGRQRQKRVDVQIAVDMLSHTYRGNMHRCTLLAGDIDFHPLLEALVRDGMFVTLWHPPQATAALMNAADSLMLLDALQLNDVLKRPDDTALLPPVLYHANRKRLGHLRDKWLSNETVCALYSRMNEWVFEAYGMPESATSSQITDTNLRTLLASAEARFSITPSAAALELAAL